MRTGFCFDAERKCYESGMLLTSDEHATLKQCIASLNNAIESLLSITNQQGQPWQIPTALRDELKAARLALREAFK